MAKGIARSARTGASTDGKRGGAFQTRQNPRTGTSSGPWAIRSASTGRFIQEKRSGDISKGAGSKD